MRGSKSGSGSPAMLAADAALAYVEGSRRIREPEATLAAVKPHLAGCGITRIADVTGLDRIGIPVVMVVRPNSRSLSVSQGKGSDLVSAAVSGVMESLELHWGERAQPTLRLCSYVDLAGSGARVVDPQRLPVARDSDYGADRRLLWAAGTDVASGAEAWVPYEMVHADASYPLVPGSGAFVRSTNGLASGNCRTEALLHAMTEIAERDALALWESSHPSTSAGWRIDPTTVVAGPARTLLEQFEAAGIDVAMWDITSDLEIPAVRVIIVDRESHPTMRPLPAAFGAGCDLDGTVAMTRALCEAAQSRLTAISGSRDDLTRARYRSFQSAEALAAAQALIGAPTPRSADQLDAWASSAPLVDALEVLSRLDRAGFPDVVAIDLAPEDWPISVVRAIVPGLEGPTESPAYTPGPRATAAAMRGRR